MGVRARVLAFSQRSDDIRATFAFLKRTREEVFAVAPVTAGESMGLYTASLTVLIQGLPDPGALERALTRAGLECTSWRDGVLLRLDGMPNELREALTRASPDVLDALDHAVRAWNAPPRDLALADGRRLRLSRRAHVMGVVNVTPDSFSDGGLHLEPEAAIKHGMRLAEEGADILDVGGESTRPGAEPVDAAEETRRVLPAVRELARTGIPVSIDTMKADVARAALDAGASIVNDVSACRFDTEMLPLVAERGVPVVLMHMKGEPRTMQQDPRYDDVVGEVYAFLAERAGAAVAAGVGPDRILVDPGFGFGKTREHNLELLRRLREMTCLGPPVLAGTSRKSFIGLTLELPVDERLEGTAATVALAVANGAAIVRVHDAGPMCRVAGMVEAVNGGNG